MKFSERQGITKVKDIIQLESMDDDLRVSLWNVFYTYIVEPSNTYRSDLTQSGKFGDFARYLWVFQLKKTIDSIPVYKIRFIEEIKIEYFRRFKWNEVYDFFEFIISIYPEDDKMEFLSSLNDVLQIEHSGYRIINDEFVPISDDAQLGSIQKAIDNTSTNIFTGVNAHLKASISLLSDKTNPDYRNSIKESISALESLCIIISGKPKATLGNALSTLKSKIDLHASLEKSFCQLYGYTSDGDGIRHGMMDLPTLDQEDAIYMLISCSSFINYLIIKANKANIKFC